MITRDIEKSIRFDYVFVDRDSSVQRSSLYPFQTDKVADLWTLLAN